MTLLKIRHELLCQFEVFPTLQYYFIIIIIKLLTYCVRVYPSILKDTEEYHSPFEYKNEGIWIEIVEYVI